MTIPKNPFAKKLSTNDARRVRLVRPELVAQVEFRTWTTEGPDPARIVPRTSRVSLHADHCAMLYPCVAISELCVAVRLPRSQNSLPYQGHESRISKGRLSHVPAGNISISDA